MAVMFWSSLETQVRSAYDFASRLDGDVQVLAVGGLVEGEEVRGRADKILLSILDAIKIVPLLLLTAISSR